MSRLALAMSTAPLSSAAMPTPEPPPETSTSTSGATLRYSSAQTWATLTIVSEPLFWITVLAGLAACWPLPPPHETRTPEQATAREKERATRAGDLDHGGLLRSFD